MKKNKLVNVIVSLALTLLFYNCQNEPLEQNIDLSEASKVLSGIKQENTTLQEIKNDPYLNSILEKASKNIKKDRNPSKNTNATFSNLNLSNQVKK